MRWKSETYMGWGRALMAEGDLARPEKINGIADAPPVPAFGMRRSYGDACLNSDGRALDMTRLDRILSFDPDTGLLEAEAGVQIGELARIFAPMGWIPAVMPGTGFATIGGCVAMDVHGKNHHIDGTFGAHLAAIRMVHMGKVKTLTPTKTPALFRATLGGLGQTGTIISATLQMARCDGTALQVSEQRAENWDEHIALLEASRAPYSVGWIDATARGADLGRGILEEAEHTLMPPLPIKAAKSIPFNAPNWALSKFIVRAFNKCYFGRIPDNGRITVKPMEDFFFPLDKVHNWNRLYGKRGFHQFQCVVPLSQVDALRAMVEQIAVSGLASPLAVLKRMGPGRSGMMSFPMEGFTLAVDFPNRDAARGLIKALGDATAQANGRVYLAKDSLAAGKQVRAMYPEHTEWAGIAAKADPDRALETDLTRRLELRTT